MWDDSRPVELGPEGKPLRLVAQWPRHRRVSVPWTIGTRSRRAMRRKVSEKCRTAKGVRLAPKRLFNIGVARSIHFVDRPSIPF